MLAQVMTPPSATGGKLSHIKQLQWKDATLSDISEITSDFSALSFQFLFSRHYSQPGRVVHTFNPSPQKAELDRSLRVRGQPGLHCKFQASESYKMTPCLNRQARPTERQTDTQINKSLDIEHQEFC